MTVDGKMFALGEVKAADDGTDPHGAFELILSAPKLDRDGEVVDALAFQPLPDHITFDIDHGMSTATTVGSGAPRYEGELLIVKGTYSSIPRAQEVRTLVREGHIRTASVAFMGAKREVKDGVTHIVSAELLNGAFVPIPSLREAQVLSAKSYREAVGTAEDSAGSRDWKSLEGSFEERRELLRNAVRSANPDSWWSQIVATFDDAVVYQLDDDATYRAPYSITDDAVTLGSPELVTVSEVLTPAKGFTPKITTAPETPAPVAGKSPASVVTQARLTAARALLDL